VQDILDRAEAHMEKLDGLILDDGTIPELYTGETPSDVTPYAMAHGLYITATMSIRQSRNEIRTL